MGKPKPLQAHLKEHLVLALPIIISQLSHIAIVVADNVMVGWLGATPLAACALANSLAWPFFDLGIGISYGMTPLVAAADAQKDYKKTTKVLQHALVINLSFALVFCAVILLSSPLLHHLGQNPAVVHLAQPYFMLIGLSLIPLMLFQTFREYTEGLSLTKEAMYINLFCSLLNILLNYVLIYGQLGFPTLGLNGAGWATLISRMLMACMMGGYVFGAPQLRERIVYFNLKGFIRPYFVKIMRIGFPTGLEFTLESVAYTLTMIMVGWIGATTQAAHMIAVSLASVSWIAVGGIALATTIRVGNQLGLHDFSTLRTVGFVGFALGGVLMLVATLVFLGGYQMLPHFYTNERAVLDIAASLLIIVGVLQWSDGLSAIGVSALRGMEDTTIPFFITTVSHWFLGIPLAYVLCFTLAWGVQGLWWGLGMSKLLAAMAMLWRFDRKSKSLINQAA